MSGVAEWACEMRPPDQPETMCGDPAWRMGARCPAGHESEVSLCASHRGLMGMARCMPVGPGAPDCGRPVSFRLIAKTPGLVIDDDGVPHPITDVPASAEGLEHELAALAGESGGAE